MEQEINIKLEEFFKELDDSNLIKDLKNYKNRVLSNKKLLDNILKIKTLDKYSNEYKELKMIIYSDKDYSEYIKLENNFNLLILEINKRLKGLVKR